jgi:hypothetical protein
VVRIVVCLFAIAAAAASASADEDRSAYEAAQARLTEQLNAWIADRVDLEATLPPAKNDDTSDAPRLEPGERRASR